MNHRVLSIFLAMCLLLLVPVVGTAFAFTEGPDAGMEAFQYNSLQLSSVLYCRNQTYNGVYDNSHPKYSFIQPWDEHVSQVQVTQKASPSGYGYDYTDYVGNVIARIRLDPDSSVASQSISYDVLVTDANGSKTVHRVTGQVKAYKLMLEIYIQANNNPAASFSGQTFSSTVPVLQNVAFWFDVGTQTWDNCIDPATGQISDSAWNIPLSLYLSQINDFTGGQGQNPDDLQAWTQRKGTDQPYYPTRDQVLQCVQLASPTNAGDVWTLYRSPNVQQPLVDKWTQIPDYRSVNMNNTLFTGTNNLSPITNFQNDWWFRVSLAMFRPNIEKNWMNQVEATDFPSIGFVGRLWYLQLGSFVYEQSDADKPAWTWNGWQQILGPAHYFWGGVFDALGMLNPFRIFGPFQGLIETLFLIFCLGFLIWVAFQIFGNITGFHVEDYIRDLVRGAKSARKTVRS
jgi:hypothetical protein